jgi:hypothetical protein
LNVKGEIKILGDNKSVPPQAAALTKMFVMLDKKSITAMNTPLLFAVYSNGKEIQRISTSFLGPVEKREKHDDREHGNERREK